MNDQLIKGDQQQQPEYDTRDPEVPIILHDVPSGANRKDSNRKYERAKHYVNSALNWLWTGLRYVWRQIIGNRSFWEFTATIAVAVATSLYTYYARKQWKVANDTLIEIRNSKADTTRIIAASEKNAAAAENFSASADGINAQTRLAVEKFERMAKASENSIRTLQNTAKDALDASVNASHLDERPWVVGKGFKLSNEPEENKMPSITVGLVNTGKTPALKIYPMSQAGIWYNSSSPPQMGNVSTPPKSIGVLAPGTSEIFFTSDPIPYVKDAVDTYNNGTANIYIRAKIIYADVNSILHWTTVCIFHIHGRPLDEFGYCGDGNEMDGNNK